MPITHNRFEAILRKVVQDETGHLAAQVKVNDLAEAVEALAVKIGSFLDKEWAFHSNVEHRKFEDRLKAVEQRLHTRTDPKPRR